MRRSVRPCALVALVALVAACDAPRGGAAPASGTVGTSAPAYVATTLAGDTTSLAAQKGRVVLLNIWATWCHPCRAEIPELRAIHDRYRARGLQLVGVSVDADGADDDIRQFMRDFQMTYPIWRDPAERISAQFLVIGVPATFLIDKQGIVRWRRTGPIAPGDTSLTRAIDRAIAEGA